MLRFMLSLCVADEVEGEGRRAKLGRNTKADRVQASRDKDNC